MKMEKKTLNLQKREIELDQKQKNIDVTKFARIKKDKFTLQRNFSQPAKKISISKKTQIRTILTKYEK